jgi:uncharacterized repeat protein (TIGR01451 family)
MTRRTSLFILTSFTILLFNFWYLFSANQKAQAQINAFTFFIPYPENELDDQFDIANFDNSFIDENITTTISIAIQRPNTIIYYDQWEDGLEIDLVSPSQPSTQIWGDSNPANGMPPNFVVDQFMAGDVIILVNTVQVPRNPQQLFFDGGDKLTAVGGSIAVTRAVWPEPTGSLFGGAWELYPTNRWGTEIIIPVGENLDPDNPNFVGPYQREGFGVVGVNVQAAEDNTTVSLDLDADGAFEASTILNGGKHFTQISGVQVGARIQASAPIQVHLFTGNNNSGVNFEARAYTIVPRLQWGNSYVAPRSSDGDYWLYNSSTSALVVNVKTLTATTAITIPGNSTIRYSTGVTMSAATGIHFTATDDFYGIVALDEESTQDWGYALLPEENLSTQQLIGWGPGNNRTPADGDQSRVYVTALQATTIIVRYSNGLTNTFPILPLAEVPITSPTHDMTGAFLFTEDGTPFIAVWGQDQAASPFLPSIDVGTSIVPLPSLAIVKNFELVVDNDGSGTITWGDTIQFLLVTYNNSVNPLANGRVIDELPNTVRYIPGSSRVDGLPISDTVGLTPFPFDEGGYQIGTIQSLQTITSSFEVIVNDAIDLVTNKATASSDPTGETDPGEINIPVVVGRYTLDKRLLAPANDLTQIGQVVTFGLTITSTGNISLTRLPLQDEFNENHVTFLNSAPFAPDSTTPGIITWDNLAAANRFGPITPSRTINLTVSFIVDDVPAGITRSLDIATVVDAQASDGSSLPPLTDTAEIFFRLPTPTPAPAPSPTATATATATPIDDDSDGDTDPEPPLSNHDDPPPSIFPTTDDSPFAPTVVFPVNVLPETGRMPRGEKLIWSLLIITTLSLLILRVTSNPKS